MKKIFVVILSLIALQSFGQQNTFQGVQKFNDTVKLPNIIQRSLDTANFKLTVVDASGNVYKMYWPSGGSETDPLSWKLTGTSTLTGDATIAQGSNATAFTGTAASNISITNSGGGRSLLLTSSSDGGEGIRVQTSGAGTAGTNIGGYFNITRATSGTNKGILINTSGGTSDNLALNVTAGRVLVGASSSSNTAAQLELSSSTQGFLPPRMSGAQMNAISSPMAGLMIWNTDSVAYCVYNGSVWRRVGIVPPIQPLSTQFTDAANSGTSETDLLSYTLPAGKLANDGDKIVIKAMFTTPSNSNDKTLKFYFGGSSHEWSPSTISVGTTIAIEIEITRTGATTQKADVRFISTTNTRPAFLTYSETLSGTVLIKFTGTSNTASNDIVQKTMTVTYYTAP